MRIGKKKKSKTIIGRKTLYETKHDYIAGQACAIGASVIQLARLFKVTQPTINNWMRDHYSFFLSVKKGRDMHDTEHIESALLTRAKGYDKQIREEKATKCGVVECVRTIHISPDVGAAIFWLCNRQPQRWKQVNQAKFNQLNVYPNGQNALTEGKGNGKEKPIDGEVTPGDAREILSALYESGAFDVGNSLPESKIDKGTDTKTN